MNGASFRKNEIDADTVSMIRKYYQEPNMKLAGMLQNYGYTNLPKWLEPENVSELA